MSVVDASTFVDSLTGEGGHAVRARAVIAEQMVLSVPAVFGAEVASALRSMVARGQVRIDKAEAALRRARRARLVRFPFEPFSERVWELRQNITVYDAWYVALAEWLQTDLVTADGRLVDAPGPHCIVRLP